MGRYPKVKTILAYDSEAYIDESGKHRLAYGAFAYKRGEKYYTKVIRKPEEFFKFLEDYKNCLVFIHNAKYDLSLFRLTRYKDQIDKIFMDRPIAVFLKNNTWIIDSMNLLPASLKELQKVFLTDQDYQMLGVDKNYKNEVDYEKAKENRKEWNIYINRYGAKLAGEDALILYRIMEKFFELIRVGKDNYRRIISLPQLAYLEIKRLLREYLKQNNLPIIIYKRIFDKEERDPQLNAEEALLSYKGGRVEAFKVNSLSVPLTFYDVNSLYPTVMFHFAYPFAFQDTKKRDVIKAYQDQLVGIHLVSWDCRDNPIIPIVTKTTINRRQILTQVGKGRDWITSPELEKLEEECEVTIHKSIYYKAFPIFKPFVQFYYEKKENTPKDNPLYTVYKLILNSGYGKFGQNKARRTPISDIETEIVEKLIGKDKTRIKIGDKYYTLVDEHFVTTRVELKEKIAVAIASFVTAYARMYLYNIIKTIGHDKVWYCDTDSIATNAPIPQYLNFKILGEQIQKPFLGKGLGSLKEDKKGNFVILNKKVYYKTEEPYDWVPINFTKIETNKAKGQKDKNFTVKGIDFGANVIIQWNTNPFNIKFYTDSIRIKADFRQVANVVHEAEVSLEPRLKYVPLTEFWQGYPL